MKTSLSAIGLCLLSCALANAQTTHFARSLSVDANIVSLGNVSEPGFGYGLSYARHLANDRFKIGGRIGYADAPGQNGNESGFRSYGRKSERFMGDVTISYNFLKSTRHALRLGVGPSVWRRKDDLLRGALYVKETLESAEVIRVDFLREDVQEVNFGGHVMGEYEYALTPSLALGVSGGFAQFSRKATGRNPMAGIKLGYRF